jgi:protein SCO1
MSGNAIRNRVIRSASLLTATGLGLYWAYNRKLESLSRAKETVSGLPSIKTDFTLTNRDGHKISSGDLRGLKLVYFGFTNCPDVCPEELVKMSAIVSRLEEKMQITPIFITCDPKRDNVKAIDEFLKGNEFITLDYHPSFLGLCGSEEEIEGICKNFKVYKKISLTSDSGDYLLDHSIFTYLLNDKGEFVGLFSRGMKEEDCVSKILQSSIIK